jgi:hypothetical protein
MDGNLELASGLVGILLPGLMAIVNQPGWPSWLKSLLTFLASLAVAAITVAVQGDGDAWSTDRWLGSVLTILTVALATYHGLWKPTGVAPAINERTNVDRLSLPPVGARDGEEAPPPPAPPPTATPS